NPQSDHGRWQTLIPRFRRVVDDQNLDRTFLRIQTQAELFLRGSEHGHRFRITLAGRTEPGSPRQSGIVVTLKVGSVRDGAVDAIGACKLRNELADASLG